MARTIIYVDGFNLYYRALKGTPYKWLNLKALASQLLRPDNRIVAIKYYTARVTGATDPGSPRRQQAYLNALHSIPEVEIHFGRFLAKTITRPLVKPPAVGPRFVEVPLSANVSETAAPFEITVGRDWRPTDGPS